MGDDIAVAEVEPVSEQAAEDSRYTEILSRLDSIEDILTDEVVAALAILAEALKELKSEDKAPKSSSRLYRKLWGNTD